MRSYGDGKLIKTETVAGLLEHSLRPSDGSPMRFTANFTSSTRDHMDAASHFAQSDAFPGPVAVGEKMIQESMNGELWTHLGATFTRVFVAFGCAWACGVVLGALLGRSDALDQWFWPWVNTFLNMPALVVIVICYLALGMTELAAVLAVVVNKTPLIAVNVRDGVRQFESRYEEFASIYRLSWIQKIRLIWIPQLELFLFTALRTGLSLTWKIILVVELLRRSSGIGFQIHLYFQLFEVDMILAYALSFMIAMQLIEWIVVRPVSSMCSDGGKMVSWLDCWFADQLIIRAGALSLDSEVAVISGPSGVGKTTLLRGICRHNQLLNPRLVFQEPTLLPWLSVTDNLRAVCREEGLQKHWLDLFDFRAGRCSPPWPALSRYATKDLDHSRNSRKTRLIAPG